MSQKSAKKQAAPPTFEMSEDEPFGQQIQGPKSIAAAKHAAGEQFSAPMGIPTAPVFPVSRFSSDAERRAEALRLQQWQDTHFPMLQRRGLRILNVGEDGCAVECKSCGTEWVISTAAGPSEKSMGCPSGCNGGGYFVE